jgi:hypothetical protein
VKENNQISIKYQTLHKQIPYRMKAKLKVPRRLSNKKEPLCRYPVLKKLEKFLKVGGWLDSVGSNPANKSLKYWCHSQDEIIFYRH